MSMALPATVHEQRVTTQMAANDPAVIDLHSLSVTFGSRPILKNLRGDLRGKAIGLLGPNGAGKTTLIHTLLGFHEPSAGTAQIFGHDIVNDAQKIKSLIGYMPERDSFIAKMSAVHFVRLMAELSGLPSEAALERAHEALFYVGLGEARYRKVESYSTGMKQRLKLASAIVHDPKLLILDEPTNGMDPAGRQEVLELARDLGQNKGMSLLFSSHLLPDVEYVCEHVIVLGGGRLLAEGKIQELKQVHQQSFEVRLKSDMRPFARRLTEAGCSIVEREDVLIVGLRDGQSPRLLWEAAASEGEQIRYLRPQRSTLEEVFLEAVHDKAGHA
jgi:ABC-2 type transport system ATP-binding protein